MSDKWDWQEDDRRLVGLRCSKDYNYMESFILGNHFYLKTPEFHEEIWEAIQGKRPGTPHTL